MVEIKLHRGNPVATGARPCSGAAGEHHLRRPLTRLHIMIFKKRNGHERNFLERVNGWNVGAEVLKERAVDEIVLGLKSKQTQRNIREGSAVYAVYFRFKTFKSIQAFFNLSCSTATFPACWL